MSYLISDFEHAFEICASRVDAVKVEVVDVTHGQHVLHHRDLALLEAQSHVLKCEKQQN